MESGLTAYLRLYMDLAFPSLISHSISNSSCARRGDGALRRRSRLAEVKKPVGAATIQSVGRYSLSARKARVEHEMLSLIPAGDEALNNPKLVCMGARRPGCTAKCAARLGGAHTSMPPRWKYVALQTGQSCRSMRNQEVRQDLWKTCLQTLSTTASTSPVVTRSSEQR